MEKERLTIGMERVAVEYEFLNTTGQDITTEVLFPLPAEKLDAYSQAVTSPWIWHVWVEGKELPYETEVRATNGSGVDQTDLLRRLRRSTLPRMVISISSPKERSRMTSISCLKRSKPS